MFPYYKDNTGCYIRFDQFEKIRWYTTKDGQKKCQFTLPNLKKQQAIRMKNFWSVRNDPDNIKHYTELRNGYIKLPAGISSFQVSQFILNYVNKEIIHPNLTRPSYEYQTDALDELVSRNVGLLHASTGSGKTQMICDIIVRKKRNTLILVQNLAQMGQMVNDIKTILGVTPMQVSGKKLSKKALAELYPYITVCSIDSREKIDPKDYGLILLDEADTYLGADERRSWVGGLSPEFMYALTGTIKVNNVDDNVFRIYYGHKTELIMRHHIPKYKQVFSDFQYYLDDLKKFHELKAAVYSSESRNKLIIDTTLANMAGRKIIVFTEHVEHARYLAEQFKAHGKIVYTLIGEVPDAERERIRQEAKAHEGEVIIVGSVKILGRGFDLPELSLGVLTTTERFEANIEQYIGRIIRHHEGKPDPVFIDIVDVRTPVLMNQAKARLSNFNKKFLG